MAAPRARVRARDHRKRLSGPGLVRVHAARLAALGAPKPSLDGPALVAAALANRDGEEAASVRLYWRIVGRFAGDMGVAFVATGGVTLAGGVLPRVVDFLDDAVFRRAFEAKAPVDALARRIPTRLVDASRFGARRHGGDRRRAAALRRRLRRPRLGVSERQTCAAAAFSPLSCGAVAPTRVVVIVKAS